MDFVRHQRRLIVAVASAIGCLALVALVYGVDQRFRGVLIEQTQQQLLQMARNAGGQIGVFLNERAESLRLVLQQPAVLQALAAERPIAADAPATVALGHLMRMEEEGGVAGITLYDIRLRPLLHTGTVTDEVDSEVAGALLRRVMAEWRVVVVPKLEWRGDEAYALVGVPAMRPGAAAQPVGVALMRIRFATLVNLYIRPLQPYGAGYAWVVDRDGIDVWHPYAAAVGKPMLTGQPALAPGLDLSSLRAIRDGMVAGREGVGQYEFTAWRTEPGQSIIKLAGYAPVAAFDNALSVAVNVEYDHIAGGMATYTLYTVLLAGAIVVVMGIGSFAYWRAENVGNRHRQRLLTELRHMLRVTPAVVYRLKRDGRGRWLPQYVSSGLETMLGYGEHDWRSDPRWWRDRIHPDDREGANAAWKVLETDGRWEHSLRFRHRDGHYLWIRDTAIMLRGPDGKPEELVGTWLDVTASHEAQAALQLSDRVFEGAVEAIFVADADRKLLRVNGAYLALSGHEEAEVLGRPCELVRPEDDSFDLDAALDQAAASGTWRGEIRGQRKDGSLFPGWMSLTCERDAGGRATHYVGLITDLSSQRELEVTLQRLAYHDSLTGLPNRALLMELLSHELTQAAREHQRLGVLFVDLDRFKQVNGSLGRVVGDGILKHVARRLQAGLESGTILAQPGGDQFVIVLPDLVNAQRAALLAAEIARRLAEPLALEGFRLGVSASIGISVYPDDATEAEPLLHHAEAAMYHVKSAGGSSYQFYTADLSDHSLRRLRMSQALREALSHDRLRLVYQPQLALGEDRIAGVEALLRWDDPELGPVSPAEFIPLAEETGVVVGLGEWALREACRQAKAWQGIAPLRVAVNLSLRQFQEGNLPELVRSVLDETGLPPAQLELEVTESLAMADPATTVAVLHRLRELGVRLALDDFGTGYSSLAYLQRLPLDTLKIDRAFIQHLETKQDDAILTGTIISMAHALGLSVVAEGVESARQLHLLRGLGCDEIQGYYLSRPIGAEEFGKWWGERLGRAVNG